MAERTPPRLRLDQQLCFALYDASHAMTSCYRPLLERLGLTYPQYLVLLALWEDDGLTVHELGTRIGTSTGTLSPLLKRLAAAGLVTRNRDPADERVVRVTLTERGDALHEEAAAAQAAVAARTGLDPAAVAELRATLQRLAANLRGS